MKRGFSSGIKKLAVILMLSGFSAKALAQDSLQNKLTLSYEHTHFSRQFANDWKVTAIEYAHKTGGTTFIGRVNYAQRFGQEGVQFEAQAYPKLSKKIYTYIGASYSNNSPVFPRYTTGATLYAALGKGWEVEGGYRQLHFDENIWVAAGGMSKYAGNWLFQVTSYVSLNAADNQSYFVTAKRFFANPQNLVWLQIGSGVSPDERRNVQLVSGNLTSKRVTAGSKFFLWNKTQLQLTAGYARDEYREKTFGNQWNGTAGFSFLF